MNGIIIINKESDWTSHDVVARLRRLLHEKRIGHAGTLDPMATGILPVCVGKTTRLVEYISNDNKTYVAEICIGIETDSYDREGNILFENDCLKLDRQQIEDALFSKLGNIRQVPPMVSAIKINGQPLYKLAREGKSVERAPRDITINSIEILDFIPGKNPYITCRINCSKGTYIRSIAHDIGQILGCGAHLSKLQRTEVGSFTLENAYTLQQIEEMLTEEDYRFLLPPETAAANLPRVTVQDNQLRYVLHGNDCKVEAADTDICAVYDNNGLIGIGKVKDSILIMNKVLREL